MESAEAAAATMGRGLRAATATGAAGGQPAVRATRELVLKLTTENPTVARVHALAQVIEDEEQR